MKNSEPIEIRATKVMGMVRALGPNPDQSSRVIEVDDDIMGFFNPAKPLFFMMGNPAVIICLRGKTDEVLSIMSGEYTTEKATGLS